ncbi:FAD-binding oxidoreductase [Hydrogenophaga sp.]|uniref:FAD-binding oxidoreductase n=1 Tax=Hydrogenophaga sp. TaxID=1904254 RepID=UPI00286D8B69|nr:FAD-binding oxidoreductase [Hydrogenophaga sp.]
MNTVASLRALVGETAVLDASALATRSAGVLRSDHLKATLIKSLAARSSRSRAVCRVAKPRRAARPACVLRLAAHPDSGRSHPRGLVQRRLQAQALVRPSTTEELSRVLAWCHAQGIGVVLQALQEAVEAHDLVFPLDLGARGSATLGGNAATNAGSNRAIRYGMMRDMVPGLEVVLADGTVVSSMNRPIKSNTGDDLKQLFIGSEGTLGVITRLVLRLREKPQSHQAALVAVERFDAVAALLKHMDRSLGGALSDADMQALWSLRDDVMQVTVGGAPVVFDVSLPIAEMQAFVTALRQALPQAIGEHPLWVFGHLGDGNLHVIVQVPAPDHLALRQRGEALVYEGLRAFCGSVSAEHGIGLEKKPWLPISRNPGEIALMRCLKQALDPKNILNPGKMF